MEKLDKKFQIDFNKILDVSPRLPPSKEALDQDYQFLTEFKTAVLLGKQNFFLYVCFTAFISVGIVFYFNWPLTPEMAVTMIVTTVTMILASYCWFIDHFEKRVNATNSAKRISATNAVKMVNTALANLEELDVMNSPDKYIEMNKWSEKSETINAYLTALKTLGRLPVMGEYLAMERSQESPQKQQVKT